MRLFNQLLGLAAGGLLMVGFAQPARAAQPVMPGRPNVVPSDTPNRPAPQPYVYPQYNGGSNRPIGWDWWRTYPYSQYNAWRNSYWYPPYNYNFPYAPYEAYPYYPSVPQPAPIPQPWGIGSGAR
jgi:hypothetical protein